MSETTVSTKPLEIVVDDGSQKIDIKNLGGDVIGVFYFRPTDIAIINRYNEVAANFADIVEPLENISIKNDGTAEDGDEASVAALDEAEKRLFKACDYIFDGNMSEAFFGKMHPFSPVNGAFYCETALNKLGAFISAQFEQETKKINKRLDKYIARYGKEQRK